MKKIYPLSRWLRRMVNDRVAAAIAYREHRVTLFALRRRRRCRHRDFKFATRR